MRLPARSLDELGGSGSLSALHRRRSARQSDGNSAASALVALPQAEATRMARLDETRPFIAINIAVLTVSDTRTLENDTSGQTLVDQDHGCRPHTVAARAIVER